MASVASTSVFFTPIGLLHAETFAGQGEIKKIPICSGERPVSFTAFLLAISAAISTGGWIGKAKGILYDKPDIDSNHAVKEKISGMKEKYEYLTGRIVSKENFLLTQAKFDNDLIHVDRMLKIDDLSLSLLKNTDSKKVINQRRLNAKALLSGLADLDGLIFDIPKIDLASDVPLFVPVFLDTEKRDSLRAYLINKGIYCPVHWPEVAGAPSELKERELSLICDQRYSEADMYEIVDCIHSWVKSNQN